MREKSWLGAEKRRFGRSPSSLNDSSSSSARSLSDLTNSASTQSRLPRPALTALPLGCQKSREIMSRSSSLFDGEFCARAGWIPLRTCVRTRSEHHLSCIRMQTFPRPVYDHKAINIFR